MPQADPPSHASRPARGPSLGRRAGVPERARPQEPMTLPEEQQAWARPQSLRSTWWVGAPFSPGILSPQPLSLPRPLEFLVVSNGGPCSRACTGGHQHASPCGAGEGRRSPLSPPGRECLPREAWGSLQAEVRRRQVCGLGLPLLSSSGPGEVESVWWAPLVGLCEE